MKITKQILPKQFDKTTTATPAAARTPGSGTGLTAGQLLKARVLAATSGSTFLLDLGDRQITARSMVPLAPGSELWLEVGREGDIPLLNLAAKKGAIQDFLKIFLSAATPPSASAEKLSAMVDQLMAGRDPAASGRSPYLLGSLIAAAVGPEPSPAVLRALALLMGKGPGTFTLEADDILAQLAPAKDQPDGGTADAGLNKLLKVLTAHQEINMLPPGSDRQDFFLFPCFFSGESGWGEWLFSRETTEGDDGPSCSLRFFLEMSRLGALTLEVKVAGKSMAGIFSLENEEVRNHLAGRVEELTGLMEGHGYLPVSFSCRLLPGPMMQQFKACLEKESGGRRFSLLDVSV